MPAAEGEERAAEAGGRRQLPSGANAPEAHEATSDRQCSDRDGEPPDAGRVGGSLRVRFRSGLFSAKPSEFAQGDSSGPKRLPVSQQTAERRAAREWRGER